MLFSDLAQRGLGHNTEHFEEDVGRRHGGKLRVRVVRRSYLDDIGADDVQPVQATKDGSQLSRGPATSLRCTSGRGKGGIDGIDINREIHGLVTYGLADLLDDPRNSQRIDFASLDALEA